MSAPANRGTINVVPVLMLVTISPWDLQPWNLAVTFGSAELTKYSQSADR